MMIYKKALQQSIRILAIVGMNLHTIYASNNVHDYVNIASEFSDCIAIVSDRHSLRDHAAGEVLEFFRSDKDGTYWEADFAPGAKWVELDWRFPQKIEQVEFSILNPGLCSEWNIEYWDLIEDKWQPVTAKKSVSNGRCRALLEAIETSRLRLLFTVPDKGIAPTEGLRVSNARVLTYEKKAQPPYWTAKWIWAPSEDGVRAPSRVWTRRTFEVENIADVTSAWLQCAVDDVATIYINGRMVGPGRKSGVTPSMYDIQPFLVNGENVIAAALEDVGGAFGFLSEIYLNITKDGNVQSRIIPTDDSWLYVTSEPKGGWLKAGFDVSAWKPVALAHGTPPDGPWGNLAYTDKVLNGDLFRVVEEQEMRKDIHPGQWVQGLLKLSAEKPVHEDYAFVLEAEVETVGAADGRIARATTWPEIPTSKWKPGEIHEVPFRMWMGKFAPHGAVNLSMQAVGNGRIAQMTGLANNTPVQGAVALQMLNIVRFQEDMPFEPGKPEIRIYGDAPTLFIAGKPYPPIVLTQFDISNRALAELAKTDIGIYRIATFGQVVTTPELQGEHLKKMFTDLDVNISRIDQYNPHSYLILSVMMRVTPEWAQKYPDELYLAGNGKRGFGPSMASGQFQNDAQKVIRRLVEYVESQPYGNRVIGYTFLAGGGGEFHHYGPQMGMVPRSEAFLGDYSPPAIASFREWLRSEYKGDVAALRKAWRDDAVDFETVVPKNERLIAEAETGFFRSPGKTRDVSDYFRWYAQRNGQNLIAFCEAVKSASKGNPLCGGFYGYQISKLINQKAGDNHGGGHNALERVIDSPAVDFISLPYSYLNRSGGTAFVQNSMPQSLSVRGKLFFGEYDNRTFAAGLKDYPQRSLQETLAVHRRDMGASLATDIAWWWLDFSRGKYGQQSIPWFYDPKIVRDMRRGLELYRQLQKQPFGSTSEIAVFLDPPSSLLLDIYASIPSYNLLQRTLSQEIPAIGAPVDYYSLEDLKFAKVQERYKMYVFLNAYKISEEQKRIISEKLQRDGKTLVWVWTAGIWGDSDDLDIPSMNTVTGMDFAMSGEWQDAQIFPTVESGLKAPLTMKDWHISYFRNREFYEKRLAPVFWPKDQDVEVLGRWSFNKQPGIVVKAGKDWQSVFVGMPFVPVELLRNVAKTAGVHLYFEGAIASLHANDQIVSIHNRADSVTEGTLHLPAPAKVSEAFDKKVLSEKPVRDLEIKLNPGETRVLLLE